MLPWIHQCVTIQYRLNVHWMPQFNYNNYRTKKKLNNYNWEFEDTTQIEVATEEEYTMYVMIAICCKFNFEYVQFFWQLLLLVSLSFVPLQIPKKKIYLMTYSFASIEFEVDWSKYGFSSVWLPNVFNSTGSSHLLCACHLSHSSTSL